MDAKKPSSRTDETLVALHPREVVANVLTHLSPFIESDSERLAVKFIAHHSLPATDNRTIARSAIVLFVCGLIDKGMLRNLLRTTRRARAQPQNSGFSIVEYPVPYALELLYRSGSDFGRDGHLAVKVLFNLLDETDFSGPFTGIMFHKHTIAFRDVVSMYWESFSSPTAHKPTSSAPFASRITLFAQDCLESAVISKTRRVKLQQTIELLDGRLTLGGKSPRGEASNRSYNKLESEVSPSKSFSDANPDSSCRHSVRIEVPCPDDDDSDIRLEHPSSSTAKDRQAASRREQNGFARRNTRTQSDMSGCSRVTYTDFLIYARSMGNASTYSLVWISGIPAIDIRRPFALRKQARQRPKNDEILVDKAHSTIEYNVLRRKKKKDEKVWETCGLMCLPVPSEVIAGLVSIINDNDADKSIQDAETLSGKFSRSNAGQTPTPRRTRSTARAQFAPLGFTELQFGAISGRLPPSVRALSHYYHAEVSELQWNFRTAYGKAEDEWNIDLPELPISAKKPAGRRNDLFCLPSEPMVTVAKTLSAIAAEYENSLSIVSPVRQMSDLERVINAANHHSLALYVFQELAAGLRPTGNVAEFAHATCISGSLTCDKGSCVFAERSFSPLPHFHARLLSVAKKNKAAIMHGLHCLGVKLEDHESISDLACLHALSQSATSLVRVRLTGHLHRASLLSVPNIIDINREGNWLRKTIAQTIGGLVPQWQADEFLGHRRCGREPTGDWSTASLAHFKEMADLLENKLAPIVPVSLYRAMEL